MPTDFDPRVDRLRGLLAIGVLLGHAFDLAYLSTPDRQSMLFWIAFGARPYFGFICVVGFIVLSGYCIARSTQRNFSLSRYTWRRVTRLYPLLIVAAVLAAIFEWVAWESPHRPQMWNGPVTGWSFLYAVSGLSGFKGQFGALSPSYTISYELLYYALWGTALTVSRGRLRAGLLLATGAAVGLIVFGGSIRLGLGTHAGFASALALALLPAWLLGATLAIFQSRLTTHAHRLPVWALWLLLALVIALGWDAWRFPRVDPTTTWDVAYFTGISVLFVLTMAAWLSQPASPSRTDTFLGELSYPIFLIHGPAIMATQFALNVWGLKFGFVASMAYMLLTTFTLAVVLVWTVERPLMAWRQRGRVVRARNEVLSQAGQQVGVE